MIKTGTRSARAIAVLSVSMLSAWALPAFAEFEAPAPSPLSETIVGVPAPLTWTLRAMLGHDSNTQIVPDGTPFFGDDATEAPFVQLSITMDSGTVLRDGTPLRFSQSLTLHQAASASDGVDNSGVYDFWAYDATASLDLTAADGVTRIRPYLRFSAEDGQEELAAIGSRSLELGATAVRPLGPRTDLTGMARIVATEYDVTFPGSPERNRDGVFFEFGGDYRRTAADGRSALSVGMRLQHNASGGADWAYTGGTVLARYDRGFGGGWFGQVEASYSYRDHELGFTDIVPAGRTEQTVTELSAQMLYVIDAGRTVDFGISHDIYRANDPAFEGDRTQVWVGYTVTLQ